MRWSLQVNILLPLNDLNLSICLLPKENLSQILAIEKYPDKMENSNQHYRTTARIDYGSDDELLFPAKL